MALTSPGIACSHLQRQLQAHIQLIQPRPISGRHVSIGPCTPAGLLIPKASPDSTTPCLTRAGRSFSFSASCNSLAAGQALHHSLGGHRSPHPEALARSRAGNPRILSCSYSSVALSSLPSGNSPSPALSSSLLRPLPRTATATDLIPAVGHIVPVGGSVRLEGTIGMGSTRCSASADSSAGATANPTAAEVTVVDLDKVAQGASVDSSSQSRRMRWKPIPAPVDPEPIPVAVPDDATPSWTSAVWASNIDMKRRIFCNRSLNMKSIAAVGFDMDYTLAQYKPDAFETMAYKETVKKLVHQLGYPPELLGWEFDWRYMMDRHKYVKVAYHGFREINSEERMATYGNTRARESFDEPDYALIDTLFSLAEAYLFAQLVDYKDAHPEIFETSTKRKSYGEVYKDVRAAVDLCHRDGTLKKEVAANPGKYIYKDDQLVDMLRMMRSSGRKIFIVTNSLWDYTHVVMNYLCGKCGTTEGTPRDDKWLELFDVVITGSAKPGFFWEASRTPIFEVDVATGMLMNTENGSPLVQVGNVRPPPQLATHRVGSQGCRVFQVLYVGDHIYGDILRSKKQLGWRTMLVVPELEREIQTLKQTSPLRKEFHKLRQQRDALDDTIQRLEWAIKFDNHTEQEKGNIQREIAALEEQKSAVREAHRRAMRECHQRFHEVWGQLMKTGYQNSRFAHQVERFACLYTSHVGNLCYYSPDKSYRTGEDFVPHELQVASLFD
eukprot:jgi/Mesen1/8591/ME000005S08553